MPDLNYDFTATYCDILYAGPSPGWLIPLRGLPEKRADVRPYLQWVRADIDREARNRAVFGFVLECRDRGLAAYCVPGFTREYRASHQDVVALRCFGVDLDSGDIDDKAAQAAECLGTPSLCVRSGGRVDGQHKVHLYWQLAGDISRDRVAALWGLAARRFGGDPNFGPGRAHQPIRIAGSLHRKAEPVLVEIAYSSETVLEVSEAERRLAPSVDVFREEGDLGIHGDDSETPNLLGLSRQVSLDELITRKIGPGETEVSRFEALTRIAGMYLAQLHDANDNAACEREYGYFEQWCRTHLLHVDRDYNLRLHWARLLQRERWKRNQPRQPRARPRYFRRG